MNPPCSRCGKISSALQQDFFSPKLLCVNCLTLERAKMILNTLPEPTDQEYDHLSEWEQDFLISLRQKWQGKEEISDKQYQVLEKLWAKVNR